MKLKKYCSTTDVPWCLMAALFLVVILMSIYYSTSLGTTSSIKPAVYIYGVFIVLFTAGQAYLCFKGSWQLLRRASSSISMKRSGIYFSPMLLGVCFLCYMTGQIAFLIQATAMQRIPAFPSIQHFILLGSYPCLIGALLLLPARALSPLARLRIILDSLIIITAAATFCYYFLLAPLLVGSKATLLAKIVGGIYLSADLLAIFCLVLVVLQSGESALRPVLIMLGLAVLAMFITHQTDLSEILDGRYHRFSYVRLSLLLTSVLIVGAARTLNRILRRDGLTKPAPTEQIEQRAPSLPARRWRAFLPPAFVLLFGTLIFLLWLNGSGESFPGQLTIVYIGGFVVLVLMVLRQLLALYEVSMLQEKLQARNRSLNLVHAQLEKLATTDPLTGLPNHRTVVERLDAALAYAQASATTCSVIFMDIDYFKSINDRYGHPAGDTVLCQFGGLVKASLRADDLVGRWGGEEFVAILPALSPGEVSAIAERIRATVERQTFVYNGGLRLTCSLGIATYPYDAAEQEGLIMAADRAMYTAKHLGRNQVRTAHEPVVLALGVLAEGFESAEEMEMLGIVEALVATLEARDYETGQHARRVAALSMKLALALGLNRSEASIVSLGGLLHDLGKIALPDAILFKQGKLSEEELASVVQHPVIGDEILAPIPMLHDVAAIVRSHHEWMDGSGYPDHLRGEAIPLGARIVAVADAYDAITATRVYRDRRDSREALDEIRRHTGPQFDPRVVDALARLLATVPRPPMAEVA